MLTIDVIGSLKGFKDAIKIPNNLANDIKYRNGKIIDISYTPPRIKPSTVAGAFNVQGYSAIVGNIHAIGCDYYTGKTIIDDGKAVMNIEDSVNPKIVTAWLEE